MGTQKAVKFNLGDFLKALTVLVPIMRAVVEFMKSMEAENLPGAEKKNAVMAFVKALLTGAGNYVSELTSDVVDLVMQFVDPMIDAIASAYNSAKLWLHKAQ